MPAYCRRAKFNITLRNTMHATKGSGGVEGLRLQTGLVARGNSKREEAEG